MVSRMRTTISSLPRRAKRGILIAFDIVVLLIVLWASYSLRLNRLFVPTNEQMMIMLAAPVLAVPIFIRIGLYRAVIRYLPERAIWTVLQAMSLAALAWVFAVFLTEMAGSDAVPRSVPLIYWILGTFAIGGSRFAAKRLLLTPTGNAPQYGQVLIYGAGNAGSQLATSLLSQGTLTIGGFLDDNAALRGRDVAGIRVFSPSQIPALIENYGIKEVVLSMPSISVARRQAIVAKLSRYPLRIRTLPPITDLVAGKYLVNQIREIDIDELLGRSSVPADAGLLRNMIEGKNILVTGAGGSIGSELCRLIVRWAPAKLVLYEANEFALYRIDQELTRKASCPIVPVLASVTDGVSVGRAIRNNDVEVIFHAAAHKHVPLVEANAIEGIRNNVFGTMTVAQGAVDNGVKNFVLISTDKAVRPTNVMGATKRWAELILREQSLGVHERGEGTRFCAVRFGNVLGSNGSVVPVFKEQIAAGGPVTVTDTRMTRYFMSIYEAAELIVQAAALSEGGDVFLLEMGTPVRIQELAENMIRLAGFSVRDQHHPEGDIEIVITGARPGEKMFEELFYDEATALPTLHPKIMRAKRSSMEDRDVPAALQKLKVAVDANDEAAARAILFDFIKP
ncbi:polysaccharide biosynthesis protein [Mesorhizobium sp. CGMCC 1.15528]|uniref:Polysaccharide biosynthesis protein n=2 Tax=Phyllobacteriaceae TaxID=69277 RepID=A0A7C9VAK7_9HYPH|nr:polysaccharide biosynthesis protein [Mesorhizobium zhangyense]